MNTGIYIQTQKCSSPSYRFKLIRLLNRYHRRESFNQPTNNTNDNTSDNASDTNNSNSTRNLQEILVADLTKQNTLEILKPLNTRNRNNNINSQNGNNSDTNLNNITNRNRRSYRYYNRIIPPTLNTPIERNVDVLQNYRSGSVFNNDPLPYENLAVNALNNVLNRLSPVPVRPTTRQIALATEAITFRSLTSPDQTVCPIDIQPFEPDVRVLRIIHCGHIFRE